MSTFNGCQPAPPLAIIGTSICLPSGINSIEELYDRVMKKMQMSTNICENGRQLRYFFDHLRTGNPWLIQNPWANGFTPEEATEFDADFFHIHRKPHRHLLLLEIISVGFEESSISEPSTVVPITRCPDVLLLIFVFLFACMTIAKLLNRGNVESLIALHSIYEALEDAGIGLHEVGSVDNENLSQRG